MPQRVFFADKALKDLNEICSFIATRDGENRAKSVEERILRTLDRLAVMPNAGRVRPDIEESPHTFLIQSWRVFYRPRRELDGIFVLRILDTRRDIEAILRRRK